MSPRRTRGAIGRGTDFDTHDFGRPTRRSRPRTKDRPDYSAAQVARVITVDRGRYHCQMVSGDQHRLVAKKARQLGRKGVIVGDLVRVVGDTSGEEGTLARIVQLEPRRTELNRTADDTDPHERPIVANADQLVIVTALADPPARPGMIDRVLVAGYDAGVQPVIALTKADLADPAELVALYEPIDVPIVVCEPGSDLSPLRELLAGKTTVFIGHSGVGKSTLINRLVPGAQRAIGQVNEATGKGRHTSTSVEAIVLPAVGEHDPGWVIDTPGVRSFGLSHVEPETILAAFSDLTGFTADCPRGCDHHTDAPECGLDGAAERGELAVARLQSFRRVLEAVDRPEEYR
ncbi:ribosome small subunit-dependent GTPase A [Propionibacterium australiense]|uniref:Small ribosomal subunit biogenesis GTPase RsgA n=1 Tax=Propionibacterium australiense TaxID=119981 RepID=A0A383S4V3_9ACTN|nr:ribosome small subunit-dependent GTPase A [Propionibacterium australiense]RLP11666.1 ribosome small subunit-dependent GTPase A [Propionibacterium australiense]RLP12179.1 ribosome small subunit-dependent GTPase A [Propionibacterium australiense]SYZ32399.1 TIGR00157: ribosome small subunit-dependent GTPase A [Propionibacterium australiense]VEH90292.1 Putative ribosome biogenesis GTPase RsgA [Propionibacterium australiense]